MFLLVLSIFFEVVFIFLQEAVFFSSSSSFVVFSVS